MLASLNPIDRSVYYVPPCMEGTHSWLIEEIHCWLNDDQAQNILWFKGSPGVGKPIIALTLVSSLVGGRLGSYFFCKCGDVALTNSASFWRTVAYDLTWCDTVVANRIIENLKGGKVDPGRADIQSHFKYLIQDPLMES